MTTKPVYPGGLMRCCLATLEDYDGPEEEGTVHSKCKYEREDANPTMIVKDGAWRWVGIDYVAASFTESTDATA